MERDFLLRTSGAVARAPEVGDERATKSTLTRMAVRTAGLRRFELYNHERLRPALGYRAPRHGFEEALRITKLLRGRKTAGANRELAPQYKRINPGAGEAISEELSRYVTRVPDYLAV